MKPKLKRLIWLAVAAAALYFVVQGGEYGTTDLVKQRMEKRRLAAMMDRLDAEIRFLEVPDARWARLDTACTAYLRSISTTKKLTGVANVDADQWPTQNGAFPIYCDADTPPDQESLVTQGSVYNR